MSKIINVDEKFTKGLIKYLADVKKVELALDENDFDDVEAVNTIVSSVFEYAGEVLGENKSDSEDVSLVFPEYLELTVSHREGDAGVGNWGVGAVVGSEIKKRIKDDDALED